MKWKQFIGNYYVSDIGMVKNVRTGRILSPETNSKGYLRVSIYGKRYFIHRIVALLFIPNDNNLPQVHHIDENKHNNTISNLIWVTNRDNNIISMKNKGKLILSDEQRQHIIEKYNMNIPVKQIADEYNIKPISVYKVIERYPPAHPGI